MDISFEGKIAVVTGATSGIGRRCARLLAAGGAFVYLWGKNDIAGQEEERQIRSNGQKALYQHTDITKAEDIRAAVNNIHSNGQVDILIHSAGAGEKTSFLDLTFEEWKYYLDVNLNGAFLVTQALARGMVKGNGGKMVLISSGSVLTGTGGGAPYVAAKAGQLGLVRALAHELAPHHIQVNAIGPRTIETPMLSNVYSEEGMRALARQVPLGRLGTVDDVANLALFLVSDLCGYMTGQFILLDGGRTYS